MNLKTNIAIRTNRFHQEQVIEITGEFDEAYNTLHKTGEWVFSGQSKDEALSGSAVQQVMCSAVIKAGLEKRATVHPLRHRFATHLLEGGTEIRYLQELIGHSSVKTTMRCPHLTPKATRKIVSPLDCLVNQTKSKNEKSKSDKVMSRFIN